MEASLHHEKCHVLQEQPPHNSSSSSGFIDTLLKQFWDNPALHNFEVFLQVKAFAVSPVTQAQICKSRATAARIHLAAFSFVFRLKVQT